MTGLMLDQTFRIQKGPLEGKSVGFVFRPAILSQPCLHTPMLTVFGTRISILINDDRLLRNDDQSIDISVSSPAPVLPRTPAMLIPTRFVSAQLTRKEVPKLIGG